jgi:hypothetical protein
MLAVHSKNSFALLAERSCKMNKVVNGKLYDTKSAELFCEYSFSNPSDFKHVYEALYKSPNGQFFIEYSGGPMSEYGVSCGQNETSGI